MTTPVMTDQELVQLFSRLEQELADALHTQEIAKLEGMLASDFSFTLSASPSTPISRAQILAIAPQYHIESFEIQHLACREFDNVVSVGMACRMKADVAGQPRNGEFFITDIWTRVHHHWQLSLRYSAMVEKNLTPGLVPPR